MICRTWQYSILIGRGHYRHALRLPLDEHVVIFSPPRGGKTGWLAKAILRYPGPVVSTTTKADVYALTSGVRACRGPVAVFNPQHIGGVASTFSWNPLDGCEEPAVAIRRADAFATAVSQKGVEDASFWASKASDFLRGYFHAAALAGLDLRHVARWVAGTALEEPEHILRTTPGASAYLAGQLAEMRGEANKTISTVRMTMSRGLSFLADPALAAAPDQRDAAAPANSAASAGRPTATLATTHHSRRTRRMARRPGIRVSQRVRPSPDYPGRTGRALGRPLAA